MVNQFMACMFISVSIASVSQIFLKKSASKKYDSFIREYFNPFVIGGYGLLVCSMLLTIYAYSGMDYKNGPIIEAFGNVIVLALGRLFFKERISFRKAAGIFFIMAGMAVFYT